MQVTGQNLSFVLFCAFLLVACGTERGRGADGELIDSTPVTFPDEDIRRLEEKHPQIRVILEAVEVRGITYLSDGLKVKGFLAVPKQRDEKLPCVIYNRGGNREFGAWDDEAAVLVLGRIASWGYVVVASQYRGVAGGEGQEEFGGKDIEDVLSLVPLLEAQPPADASRIGMYGWSRGGMMTYLALAKTDRIKAAVVGGGGSDLRRIAKRPDAEAMERYVLGQLIPDYYKNKEASLAARSAVTWPEKLCKTTPILMLHGTADWRVDPTQPLEMATKLLECQQPFRLIMFEGGDHGLSEYRDEVNQQARAWLDRYVRDGKFWPSLEPHGP